MAASTTGSTILASCTNMLNPGVSRMLIFVVPAAVLEEAAHSTTAAPIEIDIFRAISSSSWSVVADPSSTRPSRCVAPAV